MIRSDKCGEYEAPFDEFYLEHSIIHQTTAPYSPQSNNIAKLKNQTLKDMMNVMLISSGLPHNLWGEAILSSNHILNKIPHKKKDVTPYELWKEIKPSYKYLNVWGCLAKVVIPNLIKVKIDSKIVYCVFIGYSNNSSAQRFLVYKSNIPDIHKNTIIEPRNASFFQNTCPCKSILEKSSQKRTCEAANSSHQDVEEPRRNKRAKVSKSFGPDYLTYMLENEPHTFKEAMSTLEAMFWKETINGEITHGS